MKKIHLAGLIPVVITFSAIAGYQLQTYLASRSGTKVVISDPAPAQTDMSIRPDFTLPDKDGVMRNVSEWDGKILIINFWATWCPPCKKEIPEFIRLQTKYASQNVQFIGIALQKADEVQDFVRNMGINYPILTGELDAIALASKLGDNVGVLPFTVFIGKNKKVIVGHKGALDYDRTEAIIRSAL